MRINKTIRNVLPIFAAVIVLFTGNSLTVKADKLEVIKTYTLCVDSNGNVSNPAKFFYVPGYTLDGVSPNIRLVVPSYVTFTIDKDCRANVSYDISNGSNATGTMNIVVLRAQTEVEKLTDLYPGDYMLMNIAGEMNVKSLTVTIKTKCYYDEYKEAIAKGQNWTLVGGDVVAECTCKTKCTKEATNTECPICKIDCSKCKPAEDTTSNTDNTEAAKAAEEQKKAEEAKKLEEQKKAQEANSSQNTNSATTADSGVATTAVSDPNAAFTPEELALAQGQASQIIADAQIEAQSIIETANEQAETRLSEANEQASQILLEAGITVGQHKDTMPLGGMIALIILIIAVIGEGGVIAYTLLKDKIR